MKKINYGNMEEFMHGKRSAIRILNGRDTVSEGMYFDFTNMFSIITDDDIEIDQPEKNVSFMVWHRTKWATYGMKKFI
ncbi:hypothetical protein BSK59_15615 [Paenibacillus odorifer]|uniref:hypothetical protein n=1 Tax=Paenibacillus odorifer TaxID=189426 RepID=UPI00096BF203|nr:hypothetical protein [Paenibacillus odorifer]OME54007.1 hypothetical protein BSK59_15615 [Paenibacillus odorifer]